MSVDKTDKSAAEVAPKTSGASKTAVEAIRDMILSGELGQGRRLPPERVLAQTLGMSRSSIREAVGQLSALGILTARQGDGTYVSTLESQDLFAPLDFALRVDSKGLLHLTELRLILEPHAAAMAAGRLTDGDSALLVEALAGYDEEANKSKPDSERLIALDEQIHRVLFETAGNPLITAIVSSISSAVRRSKEQTVVMPAAPKESLTELRALVDALVARDAARAAAAMTWHVARWAERIRREVDGTGAAEMPLPAEPAQETDDGSASVVAELDKARAATRRGRTARRPR